MAKDFFLFCNQKKSFYLDDSIPCFKNLKKSVSFRDKYSANSYCDFKNWFHSINICQDFILTSVLFVAYFN